MLCLGMFSKFLHFRPLQLQLLESMVLIDTYGTYQQMYLSLAAR